MLKIKFNEIKMSIINLMEGIRLSNFYDQRGIICKNSDIIRS